MSLLTPDVLSRITPMTNSISSETAIIILAHSVFAVTFVGYIVGEDDLIAVNDFLLASNDI